MVVSHHVGAGNSTQVLCKSNKRSYPPSHPSSPSLVFSEKGSYWDGAGEAGWGRPGLPGDLSPQTLTSCKEDVCVVWPFVWVCACQCNALRDQKRE